MARRSHLVALAVVVAFMGTGVIVAAQQITAGPQGPAGVTDQATSNSRMPDGTRLVATLDNALSTRNASAEDRFTITTRSPSQYEGAVIEGTVSRVNASGRLSGRAGMALNFESIRMRNGSTYRFGGVIENVRTPNGETIGVNNEGTVEEKSQTEKPAQRGANRAAIGAGTVYVQGRDQLDLPRGTEMTITSSVPPSQRKSTDPQR